MSPRMLPPEHPDAPKYWMHETGGELCKAVESYLDGRLMTIREVVLMRAYLSQWIDSPVWEHDPQHDERSMRLLIGLRLRVRRIRTVGDIRKWLKEALAEGHDPL